MTELPEGTLNVDLNVETVTLSDRGCIHIPVEGTIELDFGNGRKAVVSRKELDEAVEETVRRVRRR